MQIRNISAVGFGTSKYVRYKNIPEELRKGECVLEQLAKENSVTLSVSKSPESKFLPSNDLYTIVAHKFNKYTKLISLGTSILITRKVDSSESVLEKLNEKAAKAILEAHKRIVETMPANSKKTEQTLWQKFKGCFIQLLKK